MNLGIFIVILFFLCVILIFTSIDKSWSDTGIVLTLIIGFTGVILMTISALKPITSSDSTVLHSYNIKDIEVSGESEMGTNLNLTLSDEDNNERVLNTKDIDIQYIVDNKAPLVEEYRVWTLFIYKDVVVIHLDTSNNKNTEKAEVQGYE